MRALLTLIEHATGDVRACKRCTSKQAAIDAYLIEALALRKLGKRIDAELHIGDDPLHARAPTFVLTLTPRGSVRIERL